MEKTFHGIRPGDPAGRCGLRNPERGFRLESLFGMGGRPAPFIHASTTIQGVDPDKEYNENWLILPHYYFSGWNATLAQCYCYLSEYADTPVLPPVVFGGLERSFATLRGLGAKAVLRFAYETEVLRRPDDDGRFDPALAAASDGPNREVLLGHVEQLAPLLRDNADVIYLLEMGFLGAWGEWHNMRRLPPDDYPFFAELTARVLAILPPERMVTMRYPYRTGPMLRHGAFAGAPDEITAATAFDKTPRSRLGHHNDSFLTGADDGAGFGLHPPGADGRGPRRGDALYDWVMRESLFVPSGGEMWWNLHGGRLDGKEALLRLRDHHYDVFSLLHSYDAEEVQNINAWMREEVDPDWLAAHHCPVGDGYFDGWSVSERPTVGRSVFDYLRDHLGYRFELQRAAWDDRCRPGGALAFSFSLINRGFKSLINPRTVELALIDGDGEALALGAFDADPRRFYPHAPGDEIGWTPLTHDVTETFALPPALPPGSYLVGLWWPDGHPALRHDARYAVRLANRDVFWWEDNRHRHGVNVVGKVRVEA